MMDLDALSPILKINPSAFIRMRPWMYLGNNDARGIDNLLESVISVSLEALEGHALQIRLEQRGLMDWELEIRAEVDLVALWRDADRHSYFSQPIFLMVLRAVSSRLEASHGGWRYHFQPEGQLAPPEPIPDGGAGHVHLRFSLDPEIFQVPDYRPDKLWLWLHVQAMTYPRSEIHYRAATDAAWERIAHPEGLRNLWMNSAKPMEGKPSEPLGGWFAHGHYRFQLWLGLSARPTVVRTFVNGFETIGHGSLLEGMVRGIRAAIRAYCKVKGVPKPSLPRDFLLWHFHLMGNVAGNGFEFYSPTKRKLYSPAAEKGAARICKRMLSKALAKDALWQGAIEALLEEDLLGPKGKLNLAR